MAFHTDMSSYTSINQDFEPLMLKLRELLNYFFSLSVPVKLLYIFAFYTVFFTLIYIPIRFVYRAYFDPLSKIPGPKWVLISGSYNKLYWDVLPGKGYGELHSYILKLHQQYGHIVRTGPRWVAINDIELYQEVYKVNSRFAKNPHFYNHPIGNESVAELVNIHEAADRRAAYNPYFSKQAIRKFEEPIQEKVSYFLDRIEAVGDKIPLDRAFRCLMADVITTYSYGKNADALSHPEFHPDVLLAFSVALGSLGFQNTFPITVTCLEWLLDHGLPRFLLPRPVKNTVRFVEECRDIIMALKGKYSKGEKDVHTIFAETFEDDEKSGRKALTYRQLQQDAVLIFSAGADTTAHGLTTLVYHLVQNPHIEEMLLNELKGIMPSPTSEITETVADGLPILTAVIKETLRISQGIPSCLPRDVPAGGVDFLGYHLPATTTLQFPAFTYHNSPDIFPDPTKWDPTRWLVGDTREMEKYWIPFGRGSRICLGLNLAWSELLVTSARLVRRFEMGFAEDFKHEDMEWKAVFIPVTKGRLSIWVKRREE
ncbi:hypothetical protein TWF694_004632 [Orbilia ellipsospora]|uniref:Cytochrome P450 n=1 Tax=Orbilia ellipsospora TaxID=2528407 RepID=A0AAV9WXY9_9PEZI